MTATAKVYSIDGKAGGSVELPPEFSEAVRPELILRAVLAENSLKLQPQGHYPLAGMQTTARYYGAMHSYRSGRHMGMAIRPRQKLARGIQGQVRRIPSAVKGKRAHPHLIEKTLVERMNRREYQKAMASAIAATAANGRQDLPLVVSGIESLSKSKDVTRALISMGLGHVLDEGRKMHVRKGLRRSSRRRHYKRSLLIVVEDSCALLKSARNLPGVDVSGVSGLTASLLAPGGAPGRLAIWSKEAVERLPEAAAKYNLRNL